MLPLILTRHGLTDRSNPEQHLGQRIDIGLSTDGKAQAAALAARIGAEHFDRIIASPLQRAREPAAAIAGNRPVEIDARLMEMDYGRWEGLSYEQIDAMAAEDRKAWIENPDVLACQGGESGNDVASRAGAFLVDLATWANPAGAQERFALVVAHSTFNRVLMCVAMGIPIREFRRRFAQGQANLTVVRWPSGTEISGGRLLVANDTSHLALRGQAPWDLAPGA